MNAPALSIIEALDDPALFQPWFRGSSWVGWRAILKAIYSLPLSDAEQIFFRSISGNRAPPAKPVKEFWAIVGRRGGKDSTASLIAAFAAR